MAKIKTHATALSVDKFLNGVKSEAVRNDCWTIVAIMQAATKAKPVMWGPAIIGFGHSILKYPDGREVDWMQVAFSPRKQAITLYLSTGFDGAEELLANMGKYTRSKACIYVKCLADIHLPTLRKLINAAAKHRKVNKKLSRMK